MITEYKDLVLWGHIRELVKLIFSHDFLPPFEGQVKRAGISIGANVAEGVGAGAGYLKRHLMTAKGSAFEVEALFILYHDLWFPDFNNIYEGGLELLKNIIKGIDELRNLATENTIKKRMK
jgi:four helix bundle protein